MTDTDEIQALREQLAAVTAERDLYKSTCKSDGRCAMRRAKVERDQQAEVWRGLAPADRDAVFLALNEGSRLDFMRSLGSDEVLYSWLREASPAVVEAAIRAHPNPDYMAMMLVPNSVITPWVEISRTDASPVSTTSSCEVNKEQYERLQRAGVAVYRSAGNSGTYHYSGLRIDGPALHDTAAAHYERSIVDEEYRQMLAKDHLRVRPFTADQNRARFWQDLQRDTRGAAAIPGFGHMFVRGAPGNGLPSAKPTVASLLAAR